MSTLYVIATPIGNLEDITLRAIRILKEVDVILCEDTRTTKRLLDTYEIKTKTVSYHAHSTSGKQDAIIEALKEGKSYALVSDAGTPAISDPGALLVRSILDLKDETLKVVAIPGPSACWCTFYCWTYRTRVHISWIFCHTKGRDIIQK